MQLCESPLAFLLPPASSTDVTGRILAAESYGWRWVRQKGSPLLLSHGGAEPQPRCVGVGGTRSTSNRVNLTQVVGRGIGSAAPSCKVAF